MKKKMIAIHTELTVIANILYVIYIACNNSLRPNVFIHVVLRGYENGQRSKRTTTACNVVPLLNHEVREDCCQ